MAIWYSASEKNLITRHGGKPKNGYGSNGIINNKPVEVRAIRASGSTRFRLGKRVHQSLVRRGGYYIFKVHGRTSVRKTARSVDRILKRKRRGWYKDRSYPHTFIYKKEIFK